ncbi:MAG: DotU family type IV/VI secretion system protein [Candidatus Desantisbacteria bacterium]|mgnify:CR=1 FL=1
MDNQMSLYELTSQLFLFLVSFRHKIRKGVAVSVSEMRSRLGRIFDDHEAIARQDVRLWNLYKRVKYPLAALADEIILTSQWEHAQEWAEELLEKRFFNTSIAGSEFFKLTEELLESNFPHKDDIEVGQIFYICLSLGFKGKYNEDAQELRSFQIRLYRHLPESIPSGETGLTPEAYHVIPSTGKKLQPVISLARAAIICIGFCILYFIVNQCLWNSTIEDIHTEVKGIIEAAK